MSRLLNNWNLKLTALVLAIALWSHVRGEVNPLETATFSVNCATKTPQNWVLSSQNKPFLVRVTLRAPRSTLREIKGGLPVNPLAAPDDAPLLSSRYLKASVDFSFLETLDEKAPAPRTFPIKVENEVEDAEVLGAKPSEISLVVARKK